MSSDKNLKGIKKFIEEAILLIEWIHDNASDFELHNDIHFLIMKDEQMDPLDVLIDSSKINRAKDFLQQEEYSVVDSVSLFKLSIEILKSFAATIENLKNINVTESYLHAYFGGLLFKYLKSKQRHTPEITHLIFYLQGFAKDDVSLIQEYSNFSTLPITAYERIGKFFFNLFLNPSKAWSDLHPFLSAILVHPKDTIQSIISYYLEVVENEDKDELINRIENLLITSEILNKEVTYNYINPDNPGESHDSTIKLISIDPFSMTYLSNGKFSISNDLNEDWSYQLNGEVDNLMLRVDKSLEEAISIDYNTINGSLIIKNDEYEVSIAMNGDGQNNVIKIDGRGVYIKEWKNNWKTKIEAETHGYEIKFGSETSTNSINGSFSIDLSHKKNGTGTQQNEDKINGTHFEIGSIELGAQLSNKGVMAAFNVKDCIININPAEGDGFLSSLVSSENEISFDFGLETGYNRSGFYFKGDIGQEIIFPFFKPLGPITFRDLYFKWGLGNSEQNGLDLNFTTSIDFDLGPLKGTIEGIGLRTALEFPEKNPIDFLLGFKPPNGVGLSIKTGIIDGGGYLNFYPEKGQYHGTFEVSFAEVVSLKVIGIIETKMPDGSKGFSMILIITADFGEGIQLGFGFTLLAVGGLMGLNRTMHLDALAKGVRTGGINSVMFPTDVIKNAPRIISDLQTYFPIQQGTFLIGPMAKLGWGTPVLITISLGIIIEIPGNIAILGVLKVVLPDEKAPLIIFQVNFIGAIEFDKQRLWFFASLFDSRILSITLEGEMGLLMAWGNHANFVASLGGFHPAFQPPTLPFPTPKRLSFNLLNKAQAKIRLQGYFAVTSNTVQFGARAELYFGFSVLNVEGHLGFDALFQFSPFYMILQVSASLSVKVFGAGMFSLGLNAKIEGPGPWNMHGKGKIKICWFWKVTVNIDTTWGDREDTTLPGIEIIPILVAEIEKRENWKANVPKHNRIGVSLRDIEASETLVLHPIGTLQISQKAIPLGLTLDKLGAQKPKDANKFEITSANTDLSKVKDLEEQFAIAQFKDLKDAEKLAAPSFEKIEGGIELSADGNQVKTAKSVKRHVRYDLIILDDSFKHRAAQALYEILKILFGALLNGNASSNANVSHKNKIRREPFEEKIIKRELGYTVANMQDNTIFDQQMIFNSHAKAKEYLQEQIAKDPRLSEEIHVLPLTELNSAA